MTVSARAQRVPLGAEIALAFLAGAATFALLAVVISGADSDVVVGLVGVTFVGAVVAVARSCGIVYAAPIAMAGVVAYDWFYVAPTHPLEFPDSANLVDLLVYLSVAVLIGELAGHAARRAEVSERGRGAIAGEQAALRRVATLVAEDVPAPELLSAVAEEAGTLLDVDGMRIARFDGGEELVHVAEWSKPGRSLPPFDRAKLEGPSVSAEVLRTGRAARIDNYEDIEVRAAFARGVEISSAVGAPIVVEGRRWGVMVAWSGEEALPGDVETRLTAFTELVATAISNSEARAEVSRLAEEQAALRRVATLVARGVPPGEVFAAVAREVGQLLGVSATHMARYEPDGIVTGVGSWSADGTHVPAGTRAALDDTSVMGHVFASRRSARMDNYDDSSGEIAALTRELNLQSSVGAPIVVDGQLWGVMVASSNEDEPLPADTESRIAAFTELVATAVSNTEARTELGRLAEEQAALRRVATLVAQGVPPSELFAAVTEEVGGLLGTDLAGMIRYEGDDLVPVATWAASGEHVEVGGRWPLEGGDLGGTISKTGRPARIDDYKGVPGRIAAFVRDELGVSSSVGSPIVVEGRVWGALFVHSTHAEPLPSDTEARLLKFTELVATAMSKAQARAEVQRLADEQAALRRVATLVARQSSPEEVFAAVAEEVARVLGAEAALVHRYEADGTATAVAEWGDPGSNMPVGTRVTLGGENVSSLVFQTERPARVDDYAKATGPLGDAARSLGLRSGVGSPIVVDGRVWGSMIASSQGAPLPADAESRIGKFTELVATAISNVEARSDLAASRARIVATTDETRRRFERDLHDGVQQRLVSLSLELRDAGTRIPSDLEEPRAQLSGIGDELAGVLDDLRELSRGIHPAILSEGGLAPALKALARRSAVPVKLDISVDKRLDERVEATAYYVVSEALANAAKHAQASVAEIQVEAHNRILDLTIHDDGVGGADPSRGSGLIGLTDRVEALGGTIAVASPAGEGTSLHVELPVGVEARSG